MNERRMIPLDVRLMNLCAAILFVGVAVAFVVGLVREVLRSPAGAGAGITIERGMAKGNAPSLRANAAPRLSGKFVTMDLQSARASFEQVPWVRRAVVQREFPNRLRVRLEEHVPVALWGEEGENRMVNTHGEVFEANAGDVDVAALVRFIGPESQAVRVFEMHKVLAPVFSKIDWDVESLELTARGGWRVQMVEGASMELGRGELTEVRARIERFVRTIESVTSRYGRSVSDVETVDLRYADGYALRIRGVGRVDTAAAPTPSAAARTQQR